MMWVSKVPNYDAYGLFRALHSHNPFYAPLRSVLNMCHWHIAPQYSHIVGAASHFCAHIGFLVSYIIFHDLHDLLHCLQGIFDFFMFHTVPDIRETIPHNLMLFTEFF